MHRMSWAACIAANVFVSAHAEPLTLEATLALARERAPRIVAARASIDEARGRLTGASAWLRDNPTLGGAVGRRRNPDGGSFTDGEVSLSQTFELGGQRGDRVARARADLEHAAADSDDVRRLALREVAVAFLRALHAQEVVRVGSDAEAVAAEILRVAERRHQLGDVSVLDVNVARAALIRARSNLRAETAGRAAALGELRALLGLGVDAPLEVTGDLHRPVDAAAIATRPPLRPDLRALAAERRGAEAESRLGRALAWPDLGLGFRYQRDEGANIFLGEISLTLPIFEHGQGVRAEAGARQRRLQLELDAAARTVAVEVAAAAVVYRELATATDLAREELPLLDENDRLARRSYESGQMSLPELLLLRREIIDGRRQALDRTLEASVAGVELEASAGVLR